jgi:hypothetical protein
MNDIETLPRLIDQAMAALDNATTAAEVLDARDQAKVAYDAAKSAARFAKAKSAHATILATCHRMQADALSIEARAQSRLADEYDMAQERGEVQQHGGQGKRDIPDKNIPPVTDIGLTSKEVHEARQVRNAEVREPGLVRKTVDAKLAAGKEPTRADVKRAVKSPDSQMATAQPKPKPKPKPEPEPEPVYCSFCSKSQHEVRKVVAGPTVFICDECVGLCTDIIREESAEPSKTTVEQRHYNFLYRASQAIFYGKEGFKAAEDSEITMEMLGDARRAVTVWSDLVIELERRFNASK